MKRFFLGALVLLVFSANWAQWLDKDGKKTADTAWKKSKGKFGVMLLITDKPDELFDAWEKETPGVEISSTDKARRGVPIVGIIVFTGCMADGNGNCNSTVEWSVQKPDGQPYVKPRTGEVWVDKKAPPERALQLSVGNLAIVIEEEDPGGAYILRAKVWDKVGFIELEVERQFSVDDGEEGPAG